MGKEGENVLTKYDLRKYKNIKAEMLELQERITEISTVMTSPKIPRLSGAPGGGGGSHDHLCDTLEKLDALRETYYKKLGVLADLQLQIEKAIEGLSPDEQMLLRLYYFSNYTWEQVAVRLDYSWAQVHRKHKLILEKLAQNEKAGNVDCGKVKDDIE